jgi:hypothetical protein
MAHQLNTSLDGVLDHLKKTFSDIEKQERRLLESIRNRNEEMQMKLDTISENSDVDEEESFLMGDNKFRSLKEVETLEKLNNETHKLVNETLKLKIDAVKFYGTLVTSKNIDLKENDNSSSDSSDGRTLSSEDLQFLRSKLRESNYELEFKQK